MIITFEGACIKVDLNQDQNFLRKSMTNLFKTSLHHLKSRPWRIAAALFSLAQMTKVNPNLSLGSGVVINYIHLSCMSSPISTVTVCFIQSYSSYLSSPVLIVVLFQSGSFLWGQLIQPALFLFPVQWSCQPERYIEVSNRSTPALASD